MIFPSHTYINSDVDTVRRFFTPDLLHAIHDGITVADHLEQLADRLWQGIVSRDNAVYILLTNLHPRFQGNELDEIRQLPIGVEDAKLCVAREYGWNTWEEAMGEGVFQYNMAFESAVDHLIYGRIEALDTLLTFIPSLIAKTSQYGHRATLLHYAACNGTEIWRQIVPENLVEIIQLLLDRGADRSTTIEIYGGHYAAYKLAETSDHLNKGGLQNEVLNLLK